MPKLGPRPRSRLARAAQRVLDGLGDDPPLLCDCADGVGDCEPPGTPR